LLVERAGALWAKAEVTDTLNRAKAKKNAVRGYKYASPLNSHRRWRSEGR
jgi:hypothetical protein